MLLYCLIIFKGNGIVLKTAKNSALEIMLDDGRSALYWNTGEHTIQPKTAHHIVFVVDAQTKALNCVIDGILCDGSERTFVYARFNPLLYDVNGEDNITYSKQNNLRDQLICFGFISEQYTTKKVLETLGICQNRFIFL